MNRRLQRWDPRGDIFSLEAAVNSLLEDGHHWSGGGPADQSTLRVDVLETASRFEILASVPGLHPEEVNVTVLADSVRIATDGPSQQVADGDDPDQRWLVRERYVGPKDRTITLPSSVAASDVTASFQDGVLRVVLPKADTARARRIPIRTGTETEASDAPIEIEESPRSDNA